jgi:transposase
VSFEKSSGLLYELAAVRVSAKQVERVAESLGAEIAEAEKKQVDQTGKVAPTMTNRKQRQEFAARFATIAPEHLILLDESGVTTSMTRLYARGAGCERIGETTPGGRWKIMTILGAMSLRGIIESMTIEEATDGHIFLAYVEHILCAALKPGDVVMMDNLSSHKIKGVQRLIEQAEAEVLYLSPYSPDLNPIEKACSKLKQILRSAKARTKEALEIAIAEAFWLITPGNAKARFNHCINGLH